MGMFSKPKVQTVTQQVQDATTEKEKAKNKARLTETEGGNKGALLDSNQGRNVRRIFG